MYFVGFLLSKEEGSPSGPEYPLSTAADILYSKYILDSIYMTAYKYALSQKQKDPRITGKDIPFSLQCKLSSDDACIS